MAKRAGGKQTAFVSPTTRPICPDRLKGNPNKMDEREVIRDAQDIFRTECTVNRRYKDDIFRDLDSQRKNGQSSLCDVILSADGKAFPAHRCVLSAASDYFRSMFHVNRFAESSSKEIELHLISSIALERILDMVYTGILKLDIDTVYVTVAAADQLMLTQVKTNCEQFLTQIIKSSDPRARIEALKIKQCAEIYNLGDLSVMAEKVISANFEFITTIEDYINLSIQEVCALLSSDQMQITPEEVLWEAAVKWLEDREDPVSRLISTDIVMQTIRFPLMGPKFLLSTVRSHPLMSSPKCQKYIQEAIEYQLLIEERSSSQTLRTKPRCTTETTIVYCLASVKHFLCFIPHKDQWFSLQAPLQSVTQYYGTKNSEPKASTSIESADSEDENEPSLSVGEEFFYGLLSVSGNVFIRALSRSHEQVGNYVLRRLQMYSISTNTWTECSLPKHVQFAILIECNGTLYSCSRKSIEAYCLEKDQWTIMMVLTLNPCQFAVSDHKRIYLFNLEDGGIEVIHTDKQFTTTKNQLMWLSRFDVLSLAKLNNHDVFLSLRTGAGMTRKIVNVRTNHWQDANKRMSPNTTTITPKPGITYPHCLNVDDPWEIAYDRNKNEMFVLAKWSAISDCPTEQMSNSSDASRKDAVLPFFKIDSSRTWRRQASLPEVLVSDGSSSPRQNVHLCISDGQTSMATSLP